MSKLSKKQITKEKVIKNLIKDVIKFNKRRIKKSRG